MTNPTDFLLYDDWLWLLAVVQHELDLDPDDLNVERRKIIRDHLVEQCHAALTARNKL